MQHMQQMFFLIFFGRMLFYACFAAPVNDKIKHFAVSIAKEEKKRKW